MPPPRRPTCPPVRRSLRSLFGIPGPHGARSLRLRRSRERQTGSRLGNSADGRMKHHTMRGLALRIRPLCIYAISAMDTSSHKGETFPFSRRCCDSHAPYRVSHLDGVFGWHAGADAASLARNENPDVGWLPKEKSAISSIDQAKNMDMWPP